jgi:hypothetical protein
MRAIIIASLLSFAGPAFAADDGSGKAAKQTSDGMGNLLKGMGQEVKKTGIGNDGKKSDKKPAKAGKEDKK